MNLFQRLILRFRPEGLLIVQAQIKGRFDGARRAKELRLFPKKSAASKKGHQTRKALKNAKRNNIARYL